MSFPVTPTDNPTPEAKIADAVANPGFSKYFTDHMAIAHWTPDGGWTGHEVRALENYEMHPSAMVLHYGQEIFEGMKAYKHEDGSVWLFRPEKNAKRFALSARRMSLPELPVEDYLDSVHALVATDAAWVPPGGVFNLYVRPFMFASEVVLGIREPNAVTYSVIATPVGSFFNDTDGVTLWVTEKYTRAARGGTGTAKCGGNYAASMAAFAEAREQGCDQVLFTSGSGDERRVDESGTMNVLFVTADGELVTPELTDTILDGVTRDSILALAKHHNLTPVERDVPLAQFLDDVRSGHITEVFAAGTVAVVTPIVGFKGENMEHVVVGDGTPGETTKALRNHLLDIQYGRREDTEGWMVKVA